MALDEARKRDLRKLHLDSRALLDSLADRLPEEELASLRTFGDVGERTLLVDGICANLVKRQIPITSGERDALAALLTLFETPLLDGEYINDGETTLAALNVME